jgi:hypothetical protein
MSPEDYLALVDARLRADGAAVTTEQLPNEQALVGYRSQFRLRWMATKLNLFTIVISTPVATDQELKQFSSDVLDFAAQQKGRFRGLQTGVAAIPVLVAETVEPAAAERARSTLVRRFGAFAWPTVVDLQAGCVHRHIGPVALGGMYASWMRQQIAVALPDPGSEET